MKNLKQKAKKTSFKKEELTDAERKSVKLKPIEKKSSKNWKNALFEEEDEYLFDEEYYFDKFREGEVDFND